MAQKRQAGLLDRRARRSALITTLTYDYPHGYKIPWHFHEWDQLVYASQMTVRTEGGSWVVPTRRAVWIPARTPHQIRMSGRVSMRTFYLKPRLRHRLPRHCQVMNVSPLMRELILHACKTPALGKGQRDHTHLIGMILDQLNTAECVPLQLPEPVDPRALRVANALLNNPSDQRALEELCEQAGANKRTIERLFQTETQMTFGKWRQQLRLLHALKLLAEGAKITQVALEAGYSTPSAFIARCFGKH
jgi:AraC-like DNA-binding protein